MLAVIHEQSDASPQPASLFTIKEAVTRFVVVRSNYELTRADRCAFWSPVPTQADVGPVALGPAHESRRAGLARAEMAHALALTCEVGHTTVGTVVRDRRSGLRWPPGVAVDIAFSCGRDCGATCRATSTATTLPAPSGRRIQPRRRLRRRSCLHSRHRDCPSVGAPHRGHCVDEVAHGASPSLLTLR